MHLMITRAAVAALIVFGASQATHAQLVSPAAPAVAPTTIWNRLGIPYGFNKIRDNRINRRGNNPQLERKPLLKAIADPANLESDNPAIKRAAEVKQAEDMAPQKIKAIKYLAKMGCGCYDKDGSITDALLQALNPVEECTPDVRLATIEAITEAVEESECPCGSCGMTCCCNEKIAMALSKSAYERTDDGCYYEPNAEIREAAANLLKICCPGRGPVNIIEMPQNGGPEVGPEVPETPDNPPVPDDVTRLPQTDVIARLRAQGIEVHELVVAPAPTQLAPTSEAVVEIVEPALIEDSIEQPIEISEETIEVAAPVEAAPIEEDYEGVVELAAPPMLPVTRLAAAPAQPAKLAAPVAANADKQVSFQKAPAKAQLQMPRSMARQTPVAQPQAQQKRVARGQVAHVDARNGVVHLQFGGNASMPVGTKLTVFHDYLTGRAALGEIEVVQSSAGAAIARPVGLAKVWKIARGDEAIAHR